MKTAMFPRQKSLYSCDYIASLIDECIETGYEIHEISEGVLGYGHMILESPDCNHWNFEITEEPLNCWSSAHTIRRCRKLSQRQIALIEGIENAE